MDISFVGRLVYLDSAAGYERMKKSNDRNFTPARGTEEVETEVATHAGGWGHCEGRGRVRGAGGVEDDPSLPCNCNGIHMNDRWFV